MASIFLPSSAASEGNSATRAVYRIQKNLGRGAYGIVYLGVDDASNKKVSSVFIG